MPHAAPLPSALDCPLCGQPNQCAVAQGQAAAGCWCMHGTVSPAALAAIAAQERGQRCICPTCGRGPPRTEPPSASPAAPL